MLTQFSPCVPVRIMFGWVATACRRLATAPAGMNVMYRTTGRCLAAWMMERVTRGRVRRVQVGLHLWQWLRRAVMCVVLACSACVSSRMICLFDTRRSKRWLHCELLLLPTF